MPVSVKEAALRIDVSPQRVRQLIDQGFLSAQKVGSQWVVDEFDLVSRERVKRAGRPLSPENALALALVADGITPESLSPSQAYRLKKNLRNLTTHGDPKNQLLSWFARRGESRFFRVDFDALREIRSDRRIKLSGVSHPLSGLLPGNELEGYVERSDLKSLIRDWFLIGSAPGAGSNIKLRVIDRLPKEIPSLFIAADLAEHVGTREQDAAASIIRGVLSD